MNRLLTSLLLVLFLSSRVAAQAQPLLYTAPFRAGENGYLIYRIPAIGITPKHTLLAFAEGRVAKRRAAGNIDVVLRRSFDLGQTWEPLEIIADLDDDFCGNPCILQDPSNGRIWLGLTRTREQDVEDDIAAGKVPGTQVWITHSDDDGATWAKPIDISATARKSTWGWYGTGPGAGLFLNEGNHSRLLMPAYHSEQGVYRAHCLYSDDHGATWKLGADAADDTSEPQAVVQDDGSLLLNCRHTGPNKERKIFVTSRDRGETWQPAQNVMPLAEYDCQGYLLRIPRANVENKFDLLFTEPTTRKRTGVHAWLSEDEGKSWPHAQPLWHGPSAYTAMTPLPDGQIGLLLECGRKDTFEQIAFMKFAPAWVKTGKTP